MEINTTLLVKKEKLLLHTTLQEAFKIPLKNPHVIIFTLLASLPFFYTQLIYETIFQRTMVAASIVLNRPYDLLFNEYIRSDVFESGTDTFTSKTFTQGGEYYCGDVLQIGLIYLVGVFIWELFSAVVTVVLASRIYRRETAMSTKEIIIEPFRKRARSNSFVTAMYVHLLSTCTLLGLIWLVANSYFVASMNSPISYFVGFLYAMAALALLKKYLEWSREWNMGIVVSILEDIHGTQALGKSAYLGKGSEDRGFLLMLVFFVWGFILRSASLYFGWYEGGANKRGDFYEGEDS